MSITQQEADNNVNFEKWVKQLDRMDEEKYSKKSEELDQLLETITVLKAKLQKAHQKIEEQQELIKKLEGAYES